MIEEFSFGQAARGAGVTMMIVETSNVGVKVGMVGRGVGGRGVMVGSFARSRGVLVGKGEEVELGMVFDSVAEIRAVGILLVGACPHAVRNKIPPSRLIKICFNVFLPIMVRCFLFALFYHLNERSQVRVPIFLLSSVAQPGSRHMH